MIKNILGKCIEGASLTEQEAKTVMDEVMSGKATESQIASLLTILRFRGETVDEMTGFARSMRDHVLSIPHEETNVIDTCGTGGDQSSTYNISTASAIALSSFGLKVAKHGNRSVSSKSGSADVLEQLQISVQTTPDAASESLRRNGMAFLFAPLYHVAMKHAVNPRKEIGFRTIFNLLGPLTNPANAEAQVIGVFNKEYGLKMAETLQRLGTRRALFVTGEDGLDEITITGRSFITEVNNGKITQYEIKPEDLGAKTAELKEVQVSTPKASADLIKAVFSGKAAGPAADILLLNVAAGLYIAGHTDSLAAGFQEGKQALIEGSYLKQLTILQDEKVEEQHA
ncbi:anthranilate phosphoribosyltransferase [Alteribacillus sp. HJP-4]|uniref:anthranilate phosphoribosyltransferase n=1 Tax=Alteribacillus sp. HJP-4 TaxID=2775394 RepID=UPI0035CD1F8A